jgi:hypothetical protein
MPGMLHACDLPAPDHRVSVEDSIKKPQSVIAAFSY